MRGAARLAALLLRMYTVRYSFAYGLSVGMLIVALVAFSPVLGLSSTLVVHSATGLLYTLAPLMASMVACLVVADFAAETLARMRLTQFTELLLSAPLSDREILAGLLSATLTLAYLVYAACLTPMIIAAYALHAETAATPTLLYAAPVLVADAALIAVLVAVHASRALTRSGSSPAKLAPLAPAIAYLLLYLRIATPTARLLAAIIPAATLLAAAAGVKHLNRESLITA